MKIVAFKHVLEGAKIKQLLKKEGNWLVLSEHDEDDILLSHNIDELYEIEEEYLYQRIPKLKNLLDQEDETVIYIDHKSGVVNVVEKHKTLVTPTDAVATNPAKSDFSYIRWIFMNSKRYINTLLLIAASIALGMWLGWFFYIITLAIIVIITIKTVNEKELFYVGALAPGIVIDESVGKIAVLVDLTHGINEYPVIRIEKLQLPKGMKKTGTRLAIAGGYANSRDDYGFWNSYAPMPIINGNSDIVFHEKKLNEIPAEEWAKLKSYSKRAETTPDVGYYPIDIETSAWRLIDIDEIDWVN